VPAVDGQGPISLDDDALNLLLQLAQPLKLEMRDPFLRAVAFELSRYQPEAIGAGLIFRIAKPLQREFFTVPKGKDFAAKYW
jgi:hypothetical protein